MADRPFLSDVETLRKRARNHIQRGDLRAGSALPGQPRLVRHARSRDGKEPSAGTFGTGAIGRCLRGRCRAVAENVC